MRADPGNVYPSITGKPGAIRLKNVQLLDNAFWGFAGHLNTVRALGVTASNNGQGLGAPGLLLEYRYTLRGLVANNNGGAGLTATGPRGRVIGSTLTGNNGGGAGVDVYSAELPAFIHSTCGHSESLTTGTPLGICAGD